jgi:Glycosyl hydrolases family 25
MIYTNTNWWNPCTGSSTALGSLAYLAVANYTSSPGTMAAGWSTFDFWQFTSSGSTAGVDQDVCHYSASALTSLVSGSQWGHPTTWCTYTVNGTERNGPTASFRSVKTFSGGSVIAGSDGTIDGYRRVSDSSGIDGYGGFILATSMTKTSAACFS